MLAREITISPGSTAKIRSPWAVALLPFATLGVYFFVWYYKINREMADYGKAKGSTELGDSPGKSLLAVTLGALVIVPAILSAVGTYKRAVAAQRLAGLPVALNGWLLLVLWFVISPAAYAYIQVELSKAWEVVANPGSAAIPGPVGGQGVGPEVPQPPPAV